LSYLDPSDLSSKCGSVGKAIPNVELSVVDERGNPLPPNNVGEVVARGSNIMMGYWKDPVETSRVLKNGYYHTGDIGRMDEDGYLYLLGRSDDMIKVSGFRVSPREVEHVLLDIEGVCEAAVIGVDDSVLGQAVAAFVVPEKDGCLTKDRIREALRSNLPAFKRPTQIELISAIPKNASGKTAGAELRMRYEPLRKSAHS
jgi:acyl-CoA synthetase (AMP-forming)/AMP-acid ligase II